MYKLKARNWTVFAMRELLQKKDSIELLKGRIKRLDK